MLNKLALRHWDWAIREAWYEEAYVNGDGANARFYVEWRHDLQDFME